MSQINLPKISSFLAISIIMLAVLTVGVVFTVNSAFTSLNLSREVIESDIVEASRVNVVSLDLAIEKMHSNNVPALDLGD
jgi:hypothetical protein